MNINKEKLKWRSRRSMLELDLFFNGFIRADGLNKLNDYELAAYQALLELEDEDLVSLLQGKNTLSDILKQSIINKIRQAAKFLS